MPQICKKKHAACYVLAVFRQTARGENAGIQMANQCRRLKLTTATTKACATFCLSSNSQHHQHRPANTSACMTSGTKTDPSRFSSLPRWRQVFHWGRRRGWDQMSALPHTELFCRTRAGRARKTTRYRLDHYGRGRLYP